MVEDDGSILWKIRDANRKREWSMVVIRDSSGRSIDDDLSVFPPANHENLSYDDIHSRESSSPSSATWLSSSRSVSSFSLSPSDSDEISPPDLGGKPPPMPSDRDGEKSPSTPSEFVGKSPGEAPDCSIQASCKVNDMWSLLLGFSRAKVVDLVAWIYNSSNYGAVARAAWALLPTISLMATALWWWMWARARRRNPVESVDKLRNVIKEKDQKIVQLLHQIAQMNELLMSRHKALMTKP